MNYQTLLLKYIRYIRDCEGIDFIDPIEYRHMSDQEFTYEEWAELQRMSALNPDV